MSHRLCFPSGLFIRHMSAVFGVSTLHCFCLAKEKQQHRAKQDGASCGKRQLLEMILPWGVCWTRTHLHSCHRNPKEQPVLSFAKMLRVPSAHKFPCWLCCQQRLHWGKAAAPLSRAVDCVWAAYVLFLKDERQKNRHRALSEWSPGSILLF